MENKPNLLLVDIETSPILGYTWGVYDVNVLSVVEPVKVICCAWKWLDGKEVKVKACCDYPDYIAGEINDKSLVTEIWQVLDVADVVIAHNGDSFDVKILNARFVSHGLNAPSDYKTVDTLKSAKKYFKFNNNSLNELGIYLEEGQKAVTGGFKTWLGCMNGDAKSWEKMKSYNAQDIKLLERIYLRLRPFIGNHPNLNTIAPLNTSKYVCSTCQSTDTIKRGKSISKMGAYQRYQCQSCGSWSSGPYERIKYSGVNNSG